MKEWKIYVFFFLFYLLISSSFYAQSVDEVQPSDLKLEQWRTLLYQNEQKAGKTCYILACSQRWFCIGK